MSEHDSFVTRFFIALNGQDAGDAFMGAVRQVTVESSLLVPDMATLVLHDLEGKWVDADETLPGTEVRIRVNEDTTRAQIFDGELVEVETEFSVGSPRVTLRAFDRMHRLSRGRKARSFVEVTDSDLVKKLAREAGLKADVEETSIVHPVLLQANESDLTFLTRRASLLGYLLTVQGDTLRFFRPPRPSGAIDVEWKQALRSFRPRMSSLGQYKKVTVRGWDPIRSEEVVAEHEGAELAPHIGESRAGGELVAERFGFDTERLVTDIPVGDDKLAKEIARAVANRHAGDFVEAEGVLNGVPGVTAGVWLKVKGVGRRFDGSYFLSEVLHHYSSAAGYEVRFSVSGFRPGGVLPLVARGASEGRIPGVRVAIVTDNLDPEGLGRVKLRYPWLTGDHGSDWARTTVIGGGAERGIEFIPEVDDEVLVGFEQGDIDRPFVLGGLWNGKSLPPEANSSDKLIGSGKVHRRLIRSREGHEIILDDSGDKPGITIRDKSGTCILIDSAEGDLALEVKGKATLKISGELTITSDQVSVDAAGDLTLSARGDLTLSAKGSIALSGADASLEATTGEARLKGMSAGVEASTTVNVKGTSINLG